MVEFIPDNSRITLKKYDENDTNRIIMEDITDDNRIVKKSIQKYRITDFNDNFILKLDVPKEISYTNYILRYYYTEKQKEEYYSLNENFKSIIKNNDDIILEFNLLQIPAIINKTIYFRMFGILYKNEIDIRNEFINSSETINKNIIKNQTFTINNLNFKLYFSNINNIAHKNYVFNLQLKIVIESEAINEDLYMIKLEMNLEKEFGEKFPLLWIITISLSVLIIIIIIAVLAIGMIKLKMNNNNLQKKVLATSFTSDKINEDIIEKSIDFKRDEDKDDAFI